MSSLVLFEFLDEKKLIAVPLCPARPQRPMRWTYDYLVPGHVGNKQRVDGRGRSRQQRERRHG